MRKVYTLRAVAALSALALAPACSGVITGAAAGGPDGGAARADAGATGGGKGGDGGGGNPVDASGSHAPAPDATPIVGEPPALKGITAAQNKVRATIPVPPFEWNASLAATAQAWADKCIDQNGDGLIDHDPDRSVGHPYYVGENIYGSGGRADPQQAVDLWASEKQYYDYATNTCAAGHVCGHYTQLVWKTTTDVGCGVSSCPGLTYGNAIVCDYGPGGNIGGQKPY